MKFALKVIVVFLIVFNFRLPYVYNSVLLSIILSTIYYWRKGRSIPLYSFLQKYNGAILIGTILMLLVSFFFIYIHASSEYLYLKRYCLILMMNFAAIYALPLLIGGKEDHALEEVIKVIVYTFALQGLIHTAGYIYTPFGEYILNTFNPNVAHFISTGGSQIDRFRCYALCGSIFFELPAAYGVAFILFFRLHLIENQKYITGWMSYIIFTLMFLGVMLSGRTGFVGIAISLAYYMYFSWKKIKVQLVNLWKAIRMYLVLLVAFYFLLPPDTRKGFEQDVFPFAFEFYYNYRDRGRLSTASTDKLNTAMYYSLDEDTIWLGHGVFSNNSKYPQSDAGYINNLVYGGIPFFLCLIIYQMLYFSRPLFMSSQGRLRQDEMDLYLFASLLVYIFILNYKSTSLGSIHCVMAMYLLIGSSYITRYYAKE